jgi:tRNA(Ile)-lysidine synthase
VSDPSQQRAPRLSPAVARVRVAVRSIIESRVREHRDGPVVVAFSGGADSFALLRATCFEAHRRDVVVAAVIVDHGLQSGSAEVAAAAAGWAEQAGCDVVRVVPVTVGNIGGMEAAARDARYEALAEVASELGSDTVLIGHTADDQAETVLLGLTRGSGPASLRGMPDRDGVFVRPLLSVTRATTRAACEAEGLKWWDDPHNVDQSFVRVRIREKVLPQLEEDLGPGISAALVRTAHLLRDDDDALNHMAHAEFEAHCTTEPAGVSVPTSALKRQFPAIRTRVLRLAASAAGLGALSSTHTAAIDALVTDWHGQKAIDVPGGNVERHEGRLVFTAT